MLDFNYLSSYFDAFIGLGAPAMMFFIITILSLLVGVKFSRALEGGLLMAIALTGMGAVISLLTAGFAPALQDFVKSTGISLPTADLGWAPLAVIAWGSMYTLYFALVAIVVNMVLLTIKKTKTLNVDLFNVWNLSVIGLLTLYYSNHNFILTTIVVICIVCLMLINSDTMKPNINRILGYDRKNITSTAHPLFLICPPILVINELISKFIPFIDKYDFDAEKLNEKIGFWGSKFSIGIILGLFVGILGRLPTSQLFSLAFTSGVALELFGIVGCWFAPAIKPLSDGIANLMERRFQGRQIYVAIDWPIIASRAEVWAVANLLAPILLVFAMILPGNTVLPLGGIIMTVLTPALMIITEGKVIRMTVIGTILIPIFLWAASLTANFLTQTSISMHSLPQGLVAGQQFSCVDSFPIEKILTIFISKASATFDLKLTICAIVGAVIYLAMFIWYVKRMKKINQNYYLND